jgi:hypothetical protein
MTRYLLPCECGESLPVEKTQAGQSIVCKCGRSVDIPSLRGLRELEVCEAAPQAVARPSWTPTKGTFFAGGIILAIVGTFVAAYGFTMRSFVNTAAPPQEQIDAWVQEIDDWNASQMWSFWTQARQMGLPPVVSPHVVAARQARWLMQVGYTGVGLVVTGLVVAVSPLLLGLVRR